MKKATPLILLLLLAAPLLADEVVSPLVFEEVTDSGHTAFSLLFGSVSKLDERPGDLTNVPEDVSRHTYWYRVNLGDSAIFAAADPATGYLYVDADRDLDLSNEEPFTFKKITRRTASGRTNAFLFGPVTVQAADEDKAPVEVRFLLTPDTRLKVFPAVIASGTIPFGSSRYKAAVVDANFDGRYDGVFRMDARPDVLVLDFNRDGKFDSWNSMTGEAAPLPRMLPIGRTYYSFAVAPDGSSVTIDTVEPELGTLDVGFSYPYMALWSDCGFHTLTASDGKWQLPQGQYVPVSIGLIKYEGSAKYSLVAKNVGKLAPFEITAGETSTQKFGPPLTPTPSVSKSRQTVYIGISLTGQAGETYSPGVMLDGRRLSAPKLEILSEAGATLASGSFEYG